MKYSLLWTILTLFQLSTATGCSKSDSALIAPYSTYPDTSALSWLALGDSYTIGESVTSSERFPAQAIALLKSRGRNIASPIYIARTGWTTEDLQMAIDQSKLTNSYDIVTLLIGVNDQYQGKDTAGYRKRFTQLLQKAITLAHDKTHVFVLSIPDYGVTPFGGGSQGISREIDAFNAINKEVTISLSISYIDITPASRKVLSDASLTAKDGLHPSGKQYGLWAALLSDSIAVAVR